jgi:hypothetical protein
MQILSPAKEGIQRGGSTHRSFSRTKAAFWADMTPYKKGLRKKGTKRKQENKSPNDPMAHQGKKQKRV